MPLSTAITKQKPDECNLRVSAFEEEEFQKYYNNGGKEKLTSAAGHFSLAEYRKGDTSNGKRKNYKKE
jgi:hypothetical protein